MNFRNHQLLRMPGGEHSIQKRTVKDQVADKLTYMIQSGLLQKGDELPSERELAETLRVSRESVRGAIGVLSTKGMVEVSQGARTKVVGTAGITLADSVGAFSNLRGRTAQEVNEAREVVELQVMRLAATRIGEKDLEKLRRLVELQKEMLHDPVAFQISDREFHGILYAACGNSLLEYFVSDLYDYALDFRRQALQQAGAIEQSVGDHLAIVTALSSRNAKLSEKAVTQHLMNIHRTTFREMLPKKKKESSQTLMS